MSIEFLSFVPRVLLDVGLQFSVVNFDMSRWKSC